MKKLILASLLVSSTLSASMLYPTDVKPVYLAPDSKDIAGKLLPTNGIDVIEESGDKIKFSLKGFVNPAASNVIYYSNGERIIALSFAKTKTPKYEIIKKGETGKWDEVKVIAYTTKDNLEKDLKPMLDRAKQTYQESFRSVIICTKRVNITQINGHRYLNQCYHARQLIKKMNG